jgi:hypothetical protein
LRAILKNKIDRYVYFYIAAGLIKDYFTVLHCLLFFIIVL